VAFWFAQIKQQEDNLDKITNYVIFITWYYIYKYIEGEDLYQEFTMSYYKCYRGVVVGKF